MKFKYLSGLLLSVALSNNVLAYDAQNPLHLDFEGLGNIQDVGNYYNGGAGTDYGVSFVNGLSIIDKDETGGSGNFANEPSSKTVLFFLDSTSSTLNYEAGFDTGFSFFYSSIDFDGKVTVYDGLNATGNILATLNLSALGSRGNGDPRGSFDTWAAIGVDFNGTAKSVSFAGVANKIGFDNITLFSPTAYRANQNIVLDNGYFKYGDNNQDSVNNRGVLEQPFLYTVEAEQLSFSNQAMFMAFAVNDSGDNEWNTNGVINVSDNLFDDGSNTFPNSYTEYNTNNVTIDSTGYTPMNSDQGFGTVIYNADINVSDKLLNVTNTYELQKDSKYLKVITKIINRSADKVTNLRVWTGVNDDHYGNEDSPTKERGNISAQDFLNGYFIFKDNDSGFNKLSDATQKASTLKISRTGSHEKVYLFSEHPKANSVIGDHYTLDHLIPIDPSSVIERTGDESYALYIRLDDLDVNASNEFTWYYSLTYPESSTFVDDWMNGEFAGMPIENGNGPSNTENINGDTSVTAEVAEAVDAIAEEATKSTPLSNSAKALMVLLFAGIAFIGFRRKENLA